MEQNFINFMAVSNYKTGKATKIRKSSKRFAALIKHCNDVVKQILDGTDLNSEQIVIADIFKKKSK